MKNYGRQILRKWNIFRVFFFLLSFCLCAGNLTLTSQAANSASASTVRLSKTEGTVEVSDSAGKAAFYRQDMRLANGDHTVTAERSYAWFSLEPKGKHLIRVCLGTACYVKGSQNILDELVNILGISAGHTTPDGMFTLEAARCLGCCGLAPVMMIDDQVYGRLATSDVKGIIEKVRAE